MCEYDWDLTKMIKDNNEFNSLMKEVLSLTKELVKYKGKITKNSKTLFNFLELDNKIDLLIERLYVYAHLAYYSNMGNKEYQENKEKVVALCDKVSSSLSFCSPELLSCDYETILKYIDENKDLEKYRFSLEKTFRHKDHILSEKEEKLLDEYSDAFRVCENAFENLDNVDVRFDKVKNEEGKKVDLTTSNYTLFLSSRDKNVRKSAFKSEYKYFKNHINTLSSLYIGNVKQDAITARIRGYKNSLDMYLFNDKMSSEVYNSLIKTTDKNIPYLTEYYDLKSLDLGYKMHMYDLYVNTSVMPDKKIEYKDGIELVNKALKPLGSDYLKTFNYLLNNRCVDVYPKDKKRSGAYQWGSYGIEPYVSLNYENNIDSVSTLAHEMGHAMHTYYSNSNQDYLYANYPIFLAEIASTVNEVLLSNYLINNTKDKAEKKYYLVEFLDKFKATVYRQVMFAEFEKIIHEKYEKGETLTKDLLCNVYYKLNKKHFKSVVVDKDIQYEWARIPHFYTPFYVYKYATGFISALLIVNKLLTEKDFKDKYIKFLSSGSSNYPLDLLNELGIDITNPDVLDGAFKMFGDYVEQLKELEKE